MTSAPGVHQPVHQIVYRWNEQGYTNLVGDSDYGPVATSLPRSDISRGLSPELRRWHRALEYWPDPVTTRGGRSVCYLRPEPGTAAIVMRWAPDAVAREGAWGHVLLGTDTDLTAELAFGLLDWRWAEQLGVNHPALARGWDLPAVDLDQLTRAAVAPPDSPTLFPSVEAWKTLLRRLVAWVLRSPSDEYLSASASAPAPPRRRIAVVPGVTVEQACALLRDLHAIAGGVAGGSGPGGALGGRADVFGDWSFASRAETSVPFATCPRLVFTTGGELDISGAPRGIVDVLGDGWERTAAAGALRAADALLHPGLGPGQARLQLAAAAVDVTDPPRLYAVLTGEQTPQPVPDGPTRPQRAGGLLPQPEEGLHRTEGGSDRSGAGLHQADGPGHPRRDVRALALEHLARVGTLAVVGMLQAADEAGLAEAASWPFTYGLRPPQDREQVPQGLPTWPVGLADVSAEEVATLDELRRALADAWGSQDNRPDAKARGRALFQFCEQWAGQDTLVTRLAYALQVTAWESTKRLQATTELAEKPAESATSISSAQLVDTVRLMITEQSKKDVVELGALISQTGNSTVTRIANFNNRLVIGSSSSVDQAAQNKDSAEFLDRREMRDGRFVRDARGWCLSEQENLMVVLAKENTMRGALEAVLHVFQKVCWLHEVETAELRVVVKSTDPLYRSLRRKMDRHNTYAEVRDEILQDAARQIGQRKQAAGGQTGPNTERIALIDGVRLVALAAYRDVVERALFRISSPDGRQVDGCLLEIAEGLLRGMGDAVTSLVGEDDELAGGALDVRRELSDVYRRATDRRQASWENIGLRFAVRGDPLGITVLSVAFVIVLAIGYVLGYVVP